MFATLPTVNKLPASVLAKASVGPASLCPTAGSSSITAGTLRMCGSTTAFGGSQSAQSAPEQASFGAAQE
jgi:hypothetical protein